MKKIYHKVLVSFEKLSFIHTNQQGKEADHHNVCIETQDQSRYENDSSLYQKTKTNTIVMHVWSVRMFVC